jgi:hypothetical protein
VAAGGEVGGGGEVGAVPGLGGGAGETDGEVCLPYPRRSDEQDVGGGGEVGAGGELIDEVAVDAGGGVVVEVGEGGRGRQGGEPEPAGEAAGLGGVDLDPKESFQGGGQGQALGVGASRTAGRCSAASWSFRTARWPRSCWYSEA